VRYLFVLHYLMHAIVSIFPLSTLFYPSTAPKPCAVPLFFPLAPMLHQVRSVLAPPVGSAQDQLHDGNARSEKSARPFLFHEEYFTAHLHFTLAMSEIRSILLVLVSVSPSKYYPSVALDLFSPSWL
jgi:hypothetical protein